MLSKETLRTVPDSPAFDVGILNNDENIFVVRRDHNFVLFRSNSQKRQIVLRIQRTNDAARFGGELRKKRGVLLGLLFIECTTNGNSITVNN